MKMPDLKFRRPQLSRKRPSGSSSSRDLKPPKFLADLYADLRDRRLLPLVALLLVAIVAAPILLAGGADEESTPSPSPAPSASASASRASFAVVPAEASLRDYRRRLGHRTARDPFQYPTASTSGSGSSAGKDSGSSASAPPTASEGETPSSENPPTTAHVTVKAKIVGYNIDAQTGFVDNVKPRKGIAPMTKLPNPQNPVVVFMGLSKDNEHALFLMTSNVTAYYGKGHCSLPVQPCQLLELKPGRSATFAYGYGESRYKVSLTRINAVVRTRKAEVDVPVREAAPGGGGGRTHFSK